jgi:hypothetical protein
MTPRAGRTQRLSNSSSLCNQLGKFVLSFLFPVKVVIGPEGLAFGAETVFAPGGIGRVPERGTAMTAANGLFDAGIPVAFAAVADAVGNIIGNSLDGHRVFASEYL